MNKDFNSNQIVRMLMRNPVARKVIIVGFVLGIGYLVAQPKLNDWFGWNLPGFPNDQQQAADSGQSFDPNAKAEKEPAEDEFDGSVKLEESLPRKEPTKKSSSDNADSGAAETKSAKSAKQSREAPLGELKEIRRGTFESTAGLIFSTNRKEHVLLHAKDNPTRNQSHGVFDGGEKKVFELLDEAYELAKKKDKRVYTKREGERDVHDVDMRRKIGYVGGKTGKRQGYPEAKHVRLVLEDRRVITAFPFKK